MEQSLDGALLLRCANQSTNPDAMWFTNWAQAGTCIGAIMVNRANMDAKVFPGPRYASIVDSALSPTALKR